VKLAARLSTWTESILERPFNRNVCDSIPLNEWPGVPPSFTGPQLALLVPDLRSFEERRGEHGPFDKSGLQSQDGSGRSGSNKL
jgi:hypothetical protein